MVRLGAASAGRVARAEPQGMMAETSVDLLQTGTLQCVARWFWYCSSDSRHTGGRTRVQTVNPNPVWELLMLAIIDLIIAPVPAPDLPHLRYLLPLQAQQRITSNAKWPPMAVSQKKKSLPVLKQTAAALTSIQ